MERMKKTVGLRSTFNGLLRIGALMLTVACAFVPAAAQTTEFMELSSVNAAGTQAGNGRSSRARSSDDGRFVVFESDASNLVANDTNGAVTDIFVRDLQTDTTTLVSVNLAGTGSGDGPSSEATITPNGRYVLFNSAAKNLVPGVVQSFFNVFVRDLATQTTTLVSVNTGGIDASSGGSHGASITPDGRYVVFVSGSGDIVAGDTNQRFDIFRRDLQTSTTILVSVNTAGTNGGNGHSLTAVITPDGRYVAFTSLASTDLVAIPTSGVTSNVYRRDLQTNTTVLVSVNKDGVGSTTGTGSFNEVISDDGQVVAFTSGSVDIVPRDPDTSFTLHSIYTRDFTTNTTTLISERQVTQGGLKTIPPATQPHISSDGRYVFYIRIENGVSGMNREGFRDRVFRHDRQTGTLLELPFVATGLCDLNFNCRSLVPDFVTSRDGRYVAYRQEERPRNNSEPFSTAIVVRDMVGGGTEIINGFPGVPFDFTGLNQTILTPGSVVAGGKLAFSSGVSHSATDTNALEDVYLFSPPAQNRLAFSRASYFITERGVISPFPNPIEVRRAGYLADSTVTVRFTTSDGTASSGVNTDYNPRDETLTFNAGETVKTVDFGVNIVDDNTLEGDETVNLTLSDPTGNAILGNPSTATLLIMDDDLHIIQFSDATYEVSESDGSRLITVTLEGEPAGPFTVDYRTSDGTASERSDYITAYGRLHFAEGETSKTFRVLVVDDGFVEDDESVFLTLTNPQGTGAFVGLRNSVQLTIHSNDATPAATNPINTSSFFVRQHYLDFLNREPDAEGFQFWTNEIESCGANAQCREVKRVNVSAAFFLSIEFQETGFLTYLTNKAALGTRPTFAQFELEVQRLQRDFVFGQPGAPAQLEANKRLYFDEFVTRPEFTSKFDGMNNNQYVTTLLSENNLSTTVPDIFVSRLEGQTPSQPGEPPPGIFIVRRDAANPASRTVSLSLRLNTLTSAPTAVHIHGPVTNGASAPILYTLPAGEFSDLRLTLTNEQLNFLNLGQLAVDVHTQNNPNGELSAQLSQARFRADVLTNPLNDQTLTRAQVLRLVAESGDLRRNEFNAAFVLMEYFGYLRRDPDAAGYAFWLGKLSQLNGDYIQAEMVKAFISSAEYRQRFGQ